MPGNGTVAHALGKLIPSGRDLFGDCCSPGEVKRDTWTCALCAAWTCAQCGVTWSEV